jgi:3-methyladenine DNA glycosylase AlkD
MITNTHHLALIKLFKQNQNILDNNSWVKRYLGTDKTYYGLKTGVKDSLVKNYLKTQNVTQKDFEGLLLSLSRGQSIEELSAMSTVLKLYLKYRTQMPLSLVDKLFDHTIGWCEVDCTCCFPATDLLDRWSDWRKILKQFLTDPNIHKRRASLVLLTLPLRHSDDPRLSDISFENIEALKFEKEILITKAVSWLLRSLVKFHPDELAVYLEDNKETLPRIAYREATNKLTTGRKN